MVAYFRYSLCYLSTSHAIKCPSLPRNSVGLIFFLSVLRRHRLPCDLARALMQTSPSPLVRSALLPFQSPCLLRSIVRLPDTLAPVFFCQRRFLPRRFEGFLDALPHSKVCPTLIARGPYSCYGILLSRSRSSLLS